MGNYKILCFAVLAVIISSIGWNKMGFASVQILERQNLHNMVRVNEYISIQKHESKEKFIERYCGIDQLNDSEFCVQARDYCAFVADEIYEGTNETYDNGKTTWDYLKYYADIIKTEC